RLVEFSSCPDYRLTPPGASPRPRTAPSNPPYSSIPPLWNTAKWPISREPTLSPIDVRTDPQPARTADPPGGGTAFDAGAARLRAGRALAPARCTDRRCDPGARRAHVRDPQVRQRSGSSAPARIDR